MLQAVRHSFAAWAAAAAIASLAGASSAREATGAPAGSEGASSRRPMSTELTLYRTRVDGAHGGATAPGIERASYAAVRERRRITLRAGSNRVRLERLPATVAAASLRVVDISPGGARVRSMRLTGPRWRPPSAAPRGDVAIELDTGRSIAGIVAGSSDVFVALRDRRAVRLVPAGAIESIRSRPGPTALELLVEAERAGEHTIELRYDAYEIDWTVAHIAVRDGDTVELSSSLELDNRSGASFPGAEVALVDRVVRDAAVGLASGETPVNAVIERHGLGAVAGGLVAGESERALGSAVRSPVREVLVYQPRAPALRGRGGRLPNTSCAAFDPRPPAPTTTAMVELRLPRRELAALLPGSVRLFDRAPGGRLVPVAEGELEIDRRAGVVRIAAGRSQLISASRHQLACRLDREPRRLTETVELEIANAAPAGAVVLVRINLSRWPTGLVTSEEIAGVNRGAGREYRIEVGPRASETVSYTAVYYW